MDGSRGKTTESPLEMATPESRLTEASKAYNLRAAIYRRLGRITQGVPRYEYTTTSVKNLRTLTSHPTKRVKKSQKRKTLEEAQTAALVAMKNAESRFDKAWADVNG